MNQKGFVNIALIVLLVILAGAVGYFVLINKSVQAPQNSAGSEMASWKIYRNSTYGFEIKYPPTWNLKDNSLSFSTRDGYATTFGAEDITPVGKDFTIDEMRKEYILVNRRNSYAPKTPEALKDIFIGSEAGLELVVVACEQRNSCYQKYEFFSNSTWRKGFKFSYLLVAPNPKSNDVNSSYDDSHALFPDDITTVRKVLSTFRFVN